MLKVDGQNWIPSVYGIFFTLILAFALVAITIGHVQDVFLQANPIISSLEVPDAFNDGYYLNIADIDMKMSFGVRTAVGKAVAKTDTDFVEWRASVTVCSYEEEDC